jgi:hypothetical protein
MSVLSLVIALPPMMVDRRPAIVPHLNAMYIGGVVT